MIFNRYSEKCRNNCQTQMKLHKTLRNYTRKDGTKPIRITVYSHKQTIHIPTKVYVNPQQFDETRGIIKGKSKEARDGNLIIDNICKDLTDIIVKYRLMNANLTPKKLYQEYKNPSYELDFHLFLDNAIKERSELEWSTQKHHLSIAAKLKEFQKELPFSEVDVDFLIRFERWLAYTKNNKPNTVHSNMKALKAYLNIARRKGIIRINPFEEHKITKVKTDRVFLTKDELQHLYVNRRDMKLDNTEIRVLRHFLFMCFTALRISDFNAIRHDQVVNGILYYVPLKTLKKKSKMIRIKLTNQAIVLIREEGSNEGKIFDTISEQKMNVYLKEIADKLGIVKNISNHSARHTFATIFITETNDVAALQVLLGHGDLRETMTYVHLTDTVIDDRMDIFQKAFDF